MYALEVFDQVKPYADNRRRAHSANVLRRLHGFYRAACHIGQDLAGNIRERAAAHKADRSGRFDVFILALEHPAKMEAYALQNRPDQLRFAGLQPNVEEHARGVGVLERAAIAVQPRREDHVARARGERF